MKVTYRQCAHLLNSVEELKGCGSFELRCAIASIVLEARNRVEIFQEAQKPAKGFQAFNDEVSLHRENCTIEKDGKKVVDVSLFMPLYTAAKETHKEAIEAQEKVQRDANKAFDNEIEISAGSISKQLLKEAGQEGVFEVDLLSRLLPFVEK